jgi:hypothetical protein
LQSKSLDVVGAQIGQHMFAGALFAGRIDAVLGRASSPFPVSGTHCNMKT